MNQLSPNKLNDTATKKTLGTLSKKSSFPGLFIAAICSLIPLLWIVGQQQLPWLSSPWDVLALSSSAWVAAENTGFPQLLLTSATLLIPSLWLPLACLALLSWQRGWHAEGSTALARGAAVSLIAILAGDLGGITDWSCLCFSWAGLSFTAWRNLGLRYQGNSWQKKHIVRVELLLIIPIFCWTVFISPSLAIGQCLAFIAGALLGIIEGPEATIDTHNQTHTKS